MTVTILRLGHRIDRDKRLTTHIGLTARAFGAEKLVVDGDYDKKLVESIENVASDWGGSFQVEYTENWRKTLKEFKGLKIHLTMYGLELNQAISKIKNTSQDIIIIVGGQKVPAEIYGLSDHNISVGGQPHSEVAALAVFLDRLFDGQELGWEFKGGKKIVPQKAGKKIV